MYTPRRRDKSENCVRYFQVSGTHCGVSALIRMSPVKAILGAFEKCQGIGVKNPGDPTLFQKVLKAFSVEHRTIPPGQKTYNSDVEAFHGLIEHEFYDLRKYY